MRWGRVFCFGRPAAGERGCGVSPPWRSRDGPHGVNQKQSLHSILYVSCAFEFCYRPQRADTNFARQRRADHPLTRHLRLQCLHPTRRISRLAVGKRIIKIHHALAFCLCDHGIKRSQQHSTTTRYTVKYMHVHSNRSKWRGCRLRGQAPSSPASRDAGL